MKIREFSNFNDNPLEIREDLDNGDKVSQITF